MADSKDGTVGKGCEGFDQLSRATRQRQIFGCQTSARQVALDALLRAPLPARLAVTKGPYVHSSIDDGARMSSLVQSDALGSRRQVTTRSCGRSECPLSTWLSDPCHTRSLHAPRLCFRDRLDPWIDPCCVLKVIPCVWCQMLAIFSLLILSQCSCISRERERVCGFIRSLSRCTTFTAAV